MLPDISVVIPLRDEERNVIPLFDELAAVLSPLGRPYEVIFVDDGSADATFERLASLHARDPQHVRALRFTRNFGQSAAFAAGFAHARAPLIVTMDGDLQNDPADIPRLLELARTFEIVCGWRRHRKDDYLTRSLPSAVANRLLALVTGIRLHDNGCSLKVFHAPMVKRLRLEPGLHRYLPALASRFGGRVTEVVVNHRPRRFGRSNYGLSRILTVGRDLVRLPRLMREATSGAAGQPPLYEIGDVLGS